MVPETSGEDPSLLTHFPPNLGGPWPEEREEMLSWFPWKGKITAFRKCIALAPGFKESSSFTHQNHNVIVSRKTLLWIFSNSCLRCIPGAAAMPPSMQ